MSRPRILSIASAHPALVAALCIPLVIGACRRHGEGAQPKAGASHVTASPASQAVVEAEQALDMAQREVAARKEAVAAAERAVAEAEKRAAVTAQLVAEAKQAAAVGNDATVFRAVQSRLLDDDALSAVGISARVSDGAVTLWGRVPSTALRDRAVAIARETPGVRAVENEIEVED